MNRIYVAIALGGGIGSSLRFLLSNAIPQVDGFPFGTLTANLLGCFLLSYLSLILVKHKTIDPAFKKALTTGVIGSFTTFSAFATETFQLFSSSVGLGILYILSTVAGGLLMTWLGVKTGGRP
ncbi:fluoride efflux transporter CrcB [Halobacillus salinus]|uniref:Fluoride-specific ion channel FluC n=1 Tax=Halobacillus salinus TaxID=192814 RepID=A0A4Z0H099_9BACI|nr:fluoride efflux transporter CrcB [Halobacillus salinus]TGB02232.1 fluoride efflux transporter CrcB [Halobacillus salinus]